MTVALISDYGDGVLNRMTRRVSSATLGKLTCIMQRREVSASVGGAFW